MVLFFLVAALLVIGLIGILLFTLFGRSSDESVDLLSTNIDIARQRKQNLKSALDSGAIDQENYDAELSTLEKRLAEELANQTPAKDSAIGKIVAAVFVCAFIPLAAGAFYLQLGTPTALNDDLPMVDTTVAQSDNSAEAESAPDLADVIPQLEARLQENPSDINGWKLLGRSYLMMGEPPNSETALRTAISHGHEDADILSMLAESVALQKDGDLRGEPTELLQKAIVEDAVHERSHLLLGVANQQIGEHERAIELFSVLLNNDQRGPEAIAQIQSMIQASQGALGISNSNESPSDTTNNSESEPTAANPTSPVGLSVTVSLSEAALAQSSAEQSVFIYARATQGPPMPLAVSRHQVSDLPVTVTLDDSMAMIPDLSISKFDSVTVGARISKTGDAIAQPGDWFGEQTNVSSQENQSLNIVIEQQTP
ncbi:MAG: c-type cytochrome biogenesis protein CcmI [Gammaproteobacteria bacterium]|nr:c-type cytochrome biogenesis protein CcmI [Gammaproteobacteria bacterium]